MLSQLALNANVIQPSEKSKQEIMKKNYDARFECCVDSFKSAQAAVLGGAIRIELCSSLVDGGLTPSLVLIRPRSGDFLYDDDEVMVMLNDIKAFRENGVDGIVIGALTRNGEFDEVNMKKFMSESGSDIEVTFHRAIDLSRDPLSVTEKCFEAGVRRILTSGGSPTAKQGILQINRMRNLIDSLQSRNQDGKYDFILAAGGGIDETNAEEILLKSGANQLHGSLRHVKQSAMVFRPEVPIFMGGEKLNTEDSEYEQKITDADRVTKIIKLIS